MPPCAHCIDQALSLGAKLCYLDCALGESGDCGALTPGAKPFSRGESGDCGALTPGAKPYSLGEFGDCGALTPGAKLAFQLFL